MSQRGMNDDASSRRTRSLDDRKSSHNGDLDSDDTIIAKRSRFNTTCRQMFRRL